MKTKKGQKKRTTPTGKARLHSDDPYEDLLFVVEDTFDLLDEVSEELNHMHKQITALMKKADKVKASGGKLR